MLFASAKFAVSQAVSSPVVGGVPTLSQYEYQHQQLQHLHQHRSSRCCPPPFLHALPSWSPTSLILLSLDTNGKKAISCSRIAHIGAA